MNVGTRQYVCMYVGIRQHVYTSGFARTRPDTGPCQAVLWVRGSYFSSGEALVHHVGVGGCYGWYSPRSSSTHSSPLSMWLTDSCWTQGIGMQMEGDGGEDRRAGDGLPVTCVAIMTVSTRHGRLLWTPKNIKFLFTIPLHIYFFIQYTQCCIHK